MNRPIKFRAWDGNRFLDDFYLDEDGKVHLIDIFFDVGISGNSPADVDHKVIEAQLCQFTGLLDKNGKEIYEGDVLRRAKDGDSYKFYIVVEFSDGCFGGATRPGFNHYLTAREWGSCDYDGGGYDEVIGNVWENPGLLAPSII